MRAHWKVIDGGALRIRRPRAARSRPVATTKTSKCWWTGRSKPVATAGFICVARRRFRFGIRPTSRAGGIGSGGLYNNQKGGNNPLGECGDNPVGEWNTFRIKMVGPNVTVWLNDKLVIDNVVLENYWNREKPIYPAGQIELREPQLEAMVPQRLHSRDPARHRLGRASSTAKT